MMITRALVLTILVLSGVWLVRQLAQRWRHNSLTDGRVSPLVFAVLTGVISAFSLVQLLAGLARGSVACVALRSHCLVDSYHIASAPMNYWFTISVLFFIAVFTGSLAAASTLQWLEQRT